MNRSETSSDAASDHDGGYEEGQTVLYLTWFTDTLEINETNTVPHARRYVCERMKLRNYHKVYLSHLKSFLRH